MVVLNTSTSVVDFLKSKGQDSSFTARRKLFSEGGFDKRLGEFEGSASQNLALLKSLQNTTTEEAQPRTLRLGTDISKSTIVKPPNFLGSGTGTSQPTTATPDIPSSTTATNAFETSSAAPTPDKPATFTEQIKERVPETSGQFNLTQVPDIAPPSSADVLARARGETDVQLAEEQKAFEEGRLPAQIENGIKNVRSDLASRGLIFSGATGLAEQEVRDQALVDKFNIDLKFAKILGGAIDRAARELGQDIEDIVKAAKDQRGEEVKFLRDMGLAVDPSTGELFPTFAARKEAFSQDLREAQFAFSQAKSAIQIQQAQDRLEISIANLGIALERESRLGDESTGGFTNTQVASGAVAAGVSRDEFSSLPPEVQDFFATASASLISSTNGTISDVASGRMDAEDAKELVDNSTNTDAVKEYLKGRIDSMTPPEGDDSFSWNILQDFLSGASTLEPQFGKETK